MSKNNQVMHKLKSVIQMRAKNDLSGTKGAVT